jgi:hypothetical protein
MNAHGHERTGVEAHKDEVKWSVDECMGVVYKLCVGQQDRYNNYHGNYQQYQDMIL